MPFVPSTGFDRRYHWAGHTAWGYPFNLLHNVIEHTFGYTHYKKMISAGTAGAVLASTNGSSAKQTITTGITNPDVPRVLAITIGGSGYSADSIVINGTNVEGKVIADTIAYSANGQVVGALVFKSVSSIVIPSTSGSSMTLTVDTSNKLGVNHRIPKNFGTIVEISATKAIQINLSGAINKPTALAAPTSSNLDGEFVEKNWYQSATTPDGTTFRYAFYWFHKVLVYPPKDSPEFYSTTTSTSTSSTSSSTSTSSTSSSTSVSSTSTSSTSSSTSSTSTSTTTLPL